jgi:hypothetical protein
MRTGSLGSPTAETLVALTPEKVFFQLIKKSGLKDNYNSHSFFGTGDYRIVTWAKKVPEDKIISYIP